MKNDENTRHRFTVPAADSVVNEWIARQSNLGFSLRVLIKSFVGEYGMQDATCVAFDINVKGRGRPTNQVKSMINNMLPDAQTSEQNDLFIGGNTSVQTASDPDDVRPHQIQTEIPSIQREPTLNRNSPVRSKPLSVSVDTGSVNSNQNVVNNSGDDQDDDFVDPMTLLNL